MTDGSQEPKDIRLPKPNGLSKRHSISRRN